MGIPVKLKKDGFVYMAEEFSAGDIFNAPHECYASFMCEQEKIATRVDENKLEPEKVGTMKRVMKGGSYNTKVMRRDDSESGAPIVTKGGNKQKGKVNNKSKVKADADAPAKNT